MAQQNNPSDNRPAWIGYAQLFAILAAIVIALYFAQAPQRTERISITDTSTDEGVSTVDVLKPVSTTESLVIELTGNVRLERRITITPRVAGRVDWVSPSFKNGGEIRADEVFVKFDPTEHQLKLDRMQARLRAAEARVWAERATGEEESRMFALENPGVPVPDAVTNLPVIAEMEAEVERIQISIELAKRDLEHTEVSLPYDFRVLQSDIEVGEVAATVAVKNNRLGTGYRTSALQVSVPIELSNLELLQPVAGRPAKIVADGKEYLAKAVGTSWVIAPETRLSRMFLKFADDIPNEDLPLPGTFVKAYLRGPAEENVYILPESSRQEGGTVWIVEDGVLKPFKPVEIGHTQKGWMVEEFDSGDGVVIGALPYAIEGQAVVANVVDTSS